ncbi:MAG: efflux RND transporter permease subunit [Bacteroidota bacterium]
MRLPRLAVSNRAFVAIATALVVAVGVQSFLTMPQSEDPQFDISASRVIVVFPGAGPEDLESLVVDPLETAINEADDLDRIETTIQDGIAVLSVEFDAGTDPDETYDDVLQAVTQVRPALPEGVALVDVNRSSPRLTPVFQAALVSETASDLVLAREATRLGDAIERVGAVQSADVWAAPEAEIRVGIDPERLRELGLPLGQALGAIQSAAPSLPGGSVDAGDRRFTVQTSGDFDSIDDVRRVVVAAPEGRVVYLRDVAEVGLASGDDTHRARFDGQRSVFVTAVQREGTNIFDLREDLQAELDAFTPTLHPDVELAVVFDQAVAVDERVSGFFASFVQGVLLVGLVMLLALGFRAAGVVMAAIPVSILAALFVLDLADFGIQQMSIIGLVIALGLLVDNAIVVVEDVARRVREGQAPLEAAAEGASEVAAAVVAATVTTVLSFLPMVFLGAGAGDYIKSLPLTVIFALVASLIVSLTMTPALTARLFQRRADGTVPSADGWLQRKLATFRDGRYTRWLDAALARPRRVLAVALVALVGAVSLVPVVGVSLFPKAGKPIFLLDVTTDEGASLERTDAAVANVEAWLREQPEVEHVAANVGRSNPQVYYNVIPRRERATVGQLFVEVTDPADVEALAQRAVTEAAQPGVRLEAEVFENGPPVEAPIALKVIGPDLDVLSDLAADVAAAIAATPGTQEIDNPLAQPRTDLRVAIDREKAGILGVSLADVDRAVLLALSGVEVASYRDANGDDLPVVARLPLDDATADPDGRTRRPTVDDLDRISVTAATGAAVPLAQLARLELEPEPARIDHFDLERAVTVTASAAPGANEVAVTQAVVERVEAEVALPPGYRLFVGGKLEAQQENFSSLGTALLFALFGIFGVLVLQFRSLVQPVVVLAAIPLTAVGAFPSLAALGYSFSFTAFIGLTSLVGIVVNNSILLVDTANRLIANGATVDEATRGAAERRFSPILLTTMTTVGGLIPLALTLSDLWTPLAVVIIGGLIASTALTLLVVPVLYRLLTPEAHPERPAPTEVPSEATTEATTLESLREDTSDPVRLGDDAEEVSPPPPLPVP